MAPLLFIPTQISELELIAPCDADIGPVTTVPRSFNSFLMGTGATEVSRHVRASLNVGLCSTSGSARNSLADIGSVIPRHCGADAHPIHEKIPDVPFTQHDSVAVELSANGAKSARIGDRWRDCFAGNIGPLEVGAQ